MVESGAATSSSPSTPTASTCRRRWERLVKPIVDGEVDVAHGSRVLGHADRNHFARELGIVFFNRMVSRRSPHPRHRLLQRLPRRPDHRRPPSSSGQEQFHTSEFMIKAIKRGIPAKEIPMTVEQRLHGHSRSRRCSATGSASPTRSCARGCASSSPPTCRTDPPLRLPCRRLRQRQVRGERSRAGRAARGRPRILVARQSLDRGAAPTRDRTAYARRREKAEDPASADRTYFGSPIPIEWSRDGDWLRYVTSAGPEQDTASGQCRCAATGAT